MTALRDRVLADLAKKKVYPGSYVKVETEDGPQRGKLQDIDESGTLWINAIQYPYLLMMLQSTIGISLDMPPCDPRWVARLAKARTDQMRADRGAAMATENVILEAQIADLDAELAEVRENREHHDYCRYLGDRIATMTAQVAVNELMISALGRNYRKRLG